MIHLANLTWGWFPSDVHHPHELVPVQFVVVGEEGHDRVDAAVFGGCDHVDLGAVARRDDHGLTYAVDGREARERIGLNRSRERELLADGDRRGLMAESDKNEMHQDRLASVQVVFAGREVRDADG